VSAEYYEQNHREFVASTLYVDMSDLYEPFCRLLPQGAKILDAGCGSGRDTQFFIDRGYEVVAIDASSKMVNATKELTGVDCRQMSFENLKLENDFDAVWACASLLHIRREILTSVLNDFADILSPKGLIYASFKLGTEERQVGLRYFNDMTPETFEVALLNVPGLKLNKIWITADARPKREHEKWLNCILSK
jgi:SAM-dependent methyltransferase